MDTTQHDDQLVTHSDLPAIRDLTNILRAARPGERSRECMEDLLVRLQQRATADLPPLPDGWVLRDGATAHYYRDQALFTSPAGTQMAYTPDETLALRVAGRLQPLRPTVDSATLERAAQEAASHSVTTPGMLLAWSGLNDQERAQWQAFARTVLEVAGCEVQA